MYKGFKYRENDGTVNEYDPFNVIVNIPGSPFCDDVLESKMEKFAKKQDGVYGGSGTDFAGRDYSFHFNNFRSVRRFVRYARTLKSRCKVIIYKIDVKECSSMVDINGKIRRAA